MKIIQQWFINLIMFMAILLVSSMSFSLTPDDIKKAAEGACEKIKMCMKQQIEADSEELSPGMLKMIDSMTASACQAFYETQELTVYKELHKPIEQCFTGMANMTCEQIENDHTPKACEELEKKLENMDVGTKP